MRKPITHYVHKLEAELAAAEKAIGIQGKALAHALREVERLRGHEQATQDECGNAKAGYPCSCVICRQAEEIERLQKHYDSLFAHTGDIVRRHTRLLAAAKAILDNSTAMSPDGTWVPHRLIQDLIAACEEKP